MPILPRGQSTPPTIVNPSGFFFPASVVPPFRYKATVSNRESFFESVWVIVFLFDEFVRCLTSSVIDRKFAWMHCCSNKSACFSDVPITFVPFNDTSSSPIASGDLKWLSNKRKPDILRYNQVPLLPQSSWKLYNYLTYRNWSPDEIQAIDIGLIWPFLRLPPVNFMPKSTPPGSFSMKILRTSPLNATEDVCGCGWKQFIFFICIEKHFVRQRMQKKLTINKQWSLIEAEWVKFQRKMRSKNFSPFGNLLKTFSFFCWLRSFSSRPKFCFKLKSGTRGQIIFQCKYLEIKPSEKKEKEKKNFGPQNKIFSNFLKKFALGETFF